MARAMARAMAQSAARAATKTVLEDGRTDDWGTNKRRNEGAADEKKDQRERGGSIDENDLDDFPFHSRLLRAAARRIPPVRRGRMQVEPRARHPRIKMPRSDDFAQQTPI